MLAIFLVYFCYNSLDLDTNGVLTRTWIWIQMEFRLGPRSGSKWSFDSDLDLDPNEVLTRTWIWIQIEFWLGPGSGSKWSFDSDLDLDPNGVLTQTWIWIQMEFWLGPGFGFASNVSETLNIFCTKDYYFVVSGLHNALPKMYMIRLNNYLN